MIAYLFILLYLYLYLYIYYRWFREVLLSFPDAIHVDPSEEAVIQDNIKQRLYQLESSTVHINKLDISLLDYINEHNKHVILRYRFILQLQYSGKGSQTGVSGIMEVGSGSVGGCSTGSAAGAQISHRY